jgi:hypothetical protein
MTTSSSHPGPHDKITSSARERQYNMGVLEYLSTYLNYSQEAAQCEVAIQMYKTHLYELDSHPNRRPTWSLRDLRMHVCKLLQDLIEVVSQTNAKDPILGFLKFAEETVYQRHKFVAAERRKIYLKI